MKKIALFWLFLIFIFSSFAQDSITTRELQRKKFNFGFYMGVGGLNRGSEWDFSVVPKPFISIYYTTLKANYGLNYLGFQLDQEIFSFSIDKKNPYKESAIVLTAGYSNQIDHTYFGILADSWTWTDYIYIMAGIDVYVFKRLSICSSVGSKYYDSFHTDFVNNYYTTSGFSFYGELSLQFHIRKTKAY